MTLPLDISNQHKIGHFLPTY